jgi:signal transduction histidine kinase
VSEDPVIARARAPRPSDFVVVLPVLAVVLLGTANFPLEADDRPMDAVAYACGVIGALALAFWRRWPVHVVGTVAVTTAVYVGRGYAGGPALLPGPLALLALGYAAPRRVGWIAAACYVATAAIARLVFGNADVTPLLVLVGWASAAVLAGQAIAARAERTASERERHAHAQEQALANERLRIARDLHDSVAHAIATINVQSGVAAHLIDRDPAQAERALEAIRAASSDALDELTAILSVLRGGTEDEVAPRAPIGTLGSIGELVARARSDGLAVEASVRGDVDTLGSSVSSAAYRVVQEALTNTRRHAGFSARARVDVSVAGRDALTVRVSDDGGGRPPSPANLVPTGGFGLVGMRERVEATGGTLDAHPRPDGGFEVLAAWGERT